MNNQVTDIHDEENYDPIVWVPKAHSHGTKELWKVFGILSVLTFIDIAFYFIMDPSIWRNIIFIVLGVVKAFYIVFTFMHLKFEKKWLQNIIVWPMVLILYLIWLLLVEGNYINEIRGLFYH